MTVFVKFYQVFLKIFVKILISVIFTWFKFYNYSFLISNSARNIPHRYHNIRWRALPFSNNFIEPRSAGIAFTIRTKLQARSGVSFLYDERALYFQKWVKNQEILSKFWNSIHVYQCTGKIDSKKNQFEEHSQKVWKNLVKFTFA